jgi:DNA invertase Pin-like site-specific DNA recombinase
MNELLIAYARVSTNEQDLTTRRNALVKLGGDDRNIYTDHGPTGTNRERPGLRIALQHAARATPWSLRNLIGWVAA